MTTEEENVNSLDSIMWRRQEETLALAEHCFRFLFADDEGDYFTYLAIHLEGDQDQQIALLMDSLDAEAMPAHRPEALHPVLWEFMTRESDVTLQTFAMARVALLIGVLQLHQIAEFMHTGDLANSILSYGQANMMLGRAFAMGASLFGEDSIGAQARRAVAAKLKADPKQADKASVHECWLLWQSNPARYGSKATFARDMLSKFENLESQPVIERWCRQWESETKPAQ